MGHCHTGTGEREHLKIVIAITEGHYLSRCYLQTLTQIFQPRCFIHTGTHQVNGTETTNERGYRLRQGAP